MEKFDTGRNPIDLASLEKGPVIRSSRKRVLVVFGDVSGFRNWASLPLVSPEKFSAFMVNLYKKFMAFRNGSGYFTKLMGDGLMTIAELNSDPLKRQQQAISLLQRAHKLEQSTQRFIQNLTYPKPGGFRIRLVAGDVLRIEAIYKNHRKRQLDYIGHPINLTASLLDVNRDKPCLCHVTVKEMVQWKRKNHKIKFLKVKKPSHCPKGISQDDLKALWKFQTRG